MLNLVLGRAGTGKTAYVLNEIRRRMEAGESELLLIVPEQYSHDAEKQLCAVCGDSLSMHGETLSFTRLCGHVFSETGGAPTYVLDAGGQILIMYRAIESVAQHLRVFGAKGLRPQLLEKMLDAVKEFKSLRLTTETLESIAERTSNPLRDKLRDLSLIYSAYEALLRKHGSDAADRMALLADLICESKIGTSGHIYFDGFNDFTAQELRVIEELLRKNAGLTFCLTCDLSDDSEVFELPRKTAGQLKRLAKECGVEVITRDVEVITRDVGNSTQTQPDGRPAELGFLEKQLFTHKTAKYTGPSDAIQVYAAPTRYTECEYAARKVWELARAGHRWRDIGVMARNWEDYGPICENVFDKYGIPYFSGGRADILEKPPAALIDAALELAVSGWEYRPMFRYLKTGLTDITAEDCAELENYVLKWNIRGSTWNRDWMLPTSGYGGDSDAETLARLNYLRRHISEPLARLREGVKGVTGADAKLRALYAFMEDISLPERLRDKACILEERGEQRLANEYVQVWDMIVNAMEQMFEYLGETPLSAGEFRKLLTLTLSRYDVGVIPVSLDRTVLGGMAMSRRRDLKCLIILGATDENMPKLTRGGGALSDNERVEINKLGADMPAGLEERLCREMNMLYSTLTLPSQELIVVYPEGSGEHPSFIIKRIKAMFGVSEITLKEEDYMSEAVTPCFELAALSGKTNESPMAAAAKEYFIETIVAAPAVHRLGGVRGRSLTYGSRVAPTARTQFPDSPAQSWGQGEIKEGGWLYGNYLMPYGMRRSLSARVAESLYGRKVSLSSSRVDKYYACPYQHFLQSGLRLRPRTPAEFDAPAVGIFMHYVLEGVARGIRETVGFKNAEISHYRELTVGLVERFVHEVLLDFEGKNARFIYLFRRLEEDALRIVTDMHEELRRSDFEPLDFELDFSELRKGEARQGSGPAAQGESLESTPPLAADSPLNLRGVVDRVDGWENGGKLYLRVIDYKTGKKTLNLTDVLFGRDMQMLIYLFALQKYGGERYNNEIAPAGALYIPARDVIVKAPRSVSEEEIQKLRDKELKRGGLILNDPDVLEAMENGDEKKYLPVKSTKDGAITGDSLVTPGQIGLLSNHVDHMLSGAAGEILDGSIECRPYYKNANDNACLYCEFSTVCAFDENAGDRRRFVPKMKTAEVWEALRSREHSA